MESLLSATLMHSTTEEFSSKEMLTDSLVARRSKECKKEWQARWLRRRLRAYSSGMGRRFAQNRVWVSSRSSCALWFSALTGTRETTGNQQLGRTLKEKIAGEPVSRIQSNIVETIAFAGAIRLIDIGGRRFCHRCQPLRLDNG